MTTINSDIGSGPIITSYSKAKMSVLFNLELAGITMNGAWWFAIGV